MTKKITSLSSCLLLICCCFAQQGTTKIDRTIQKTTNAVNKVRTMVDVFQPYLLKAYQLYGQGKQLVVDTKASAKNVKNNGNSNNYPVADNNTVTTPAANTTTNNTNSNDPAAGYPSSGSSNNDAGNTNASNPAPQYGGYENYSTQQYLSVTNDAVINNDGTGNWGNQNNGVYGNCLDVLTGNVMGMGEAEDKPGSIDLMFFAPTDAQNTYILMTPSFARNRVEATYMTQHLSDGVKKWRDITESEIAATKLTLTQFDRIQNNNQITGAVKNATGYAGSYTSLGTKLEGQVFAVKVEQETRTVYALVAVVKHFGTSGSNGYVKIKVKSLGVDSNGDGLIDTNSYIR